MARLWPLTHSSNGVMAQLQQEYLSTAEAERRFVPQVSELHFMSNEKEQIPLVFHSAEKDISVTGLLKEAGGEHRMNGLRCLLQRTRPTHSSGRPDSIPFQNVWDAENVFGRLDLPPSYFQIADGSVAAMQSVVIRDSYGRAVRLELIAYYLTNQGDWSMALSHNADQHLTNAFWSFDQSIDQQAPPKNFALLQHLACHPMLIPCIMLSMSLELALQRRRSLKGRLRTLEKGIGRLRSSPVVDSRATPSRTMSGFSITTSEKPACKTTPEELLAVGSDDAITPLFDLLHSCQRDQASRKGRYSAWQDHFDSIKVGFEYVVEILGDTTARPGQNGSGGESGDSEGEYRENLRHAHGQLELWTTIVWRKLESLRARDQDHTDNVDRLAGALNNIVLQRDMRLQASIARAAQRDSEDMKFIAALGSVFLPASLVASLLNVSEFVFLPGAKLFATYLGISAFLIAIVLVVCIAKPYRRWAVLL